MQPDQEALDQEELLGDVEDKQAPPSRSGGKTASRSVAVACAMSLMAFAFAGMIAFFPDQHRSNNSFADVAKELQGKAEAACDVDTPCTNCEKEGTCDVCHAEAQLTCCEDAGSSRAKCCEDEAIKKVFPGTGDPESDLCKKVCYPSDGTDCSTWQCCETEGHKCFKKHKWYAGCKETCDKEEIDTYDNKTWSCDVLGDAAPPVPLDCSTVHENCAKTACCQDANKTCYMKDNYWSACRDTGTCEAGKPYSKDAEPYNTPWNCTEITEAAE